MPSWPTVVLVLGSALVGALAGLAGARLQRRTAIEQLIHEDAKAREQLIHEDAEAWRKVLVETTGAFIDSWHEFRWFLRARSMEGSEAPVFDETAREQLDPLGTRCAQTIDKVMLVFGKKTEVGQAADAVDKRIWDVKQAVLKSKTPWSGENAEAKIEVRNLLDAANTAHREFVERAHDVCEPPSYQRALRGDERDVPRSGT
jgi:hypothetical protein